MDLVRLAFAHQEQLPGFCRDRHLSVAGTQTDLVQRLAAHHVDVVTDFEDVAEYEMDAEDAEAEGPTDYLSGSIKFESPPNAVHGSVHGSTGPAWPISAPTPRVPRRPSSDPASAASAISSTPTLEAYGRGQMQQSPRFQAHQSLAQMAPLRDVSVGAPSLATPAGCEGFYPTDQVSLLTQLVTQLTQAQLSAMEHVVIVTALFLHHLAVICCILHITACVVLTPS